MEFFRLKIYQKTHNVEDERIKEVFKKYEETPEKIYPIIDIMSKLIQINDHFTYDRLITIAGYPSMVVRPIPKEEDD